MILLGLTGSIGMGKSETARMFREEGIPVYDADASVHDLYTPGGLAVEPIQAEFPGAIVDGAVDRNELSKYVLGNEANLKKLEQIVHPLVAQVQMDFLRRMEEQGAKIVVLDIPLLYETGGEHRVDCVVVVSAPASVQRERVLDREGMTEEKFEAILQKQVPDAVKRERADFLIETDKGLEFAHNRVREIIGSLADKEGHIWMQRKETA